MFGGREEVWVDVELCENGEMIGYCNKRLCYFENRLGWFEVITRSKGVIFV